MLGLVKFPPSLHWEQPSAVAIQALVRASRVDQMADQLAGEAIDIDPLEIVDFLAAEVEDRGAVLHSSADPLVIEYVPAHETPPIDRPIVRVARVGRR